MRVRARHQVRSFIDRCVSGGGLHQFLQNTVGIDTERPMWSADLVVFEYPDDLRRMRRTESTVKSPLDLWQCGTIA